ncbi:L,D-transpeptidase [Paractinoplanes globisporus]|uniref:Ig-like domain-containing protein n=1 Tax=Paractinoplanes globisporus TaxID=113565 RepID=A0ABW6WDM0_9ACTN|nr:Ig-like domain-containing protein [Actinoplanes globisporus]
MSISRVRRPWRFAAVALIAGTVLLSSGCGHGDKSPSWQGGGDSSAAAGGGTGSGNDAASPSPSPTLSTVAVVSPAADATNVVAAIEVKYTSEDPENTSVAVTDAGGNEVKGTLDKDSKVWRPDKALAYGTKYTVTVNGTASEGKGGSTTSTFTTMAKPSKIIRVTSFLGDGQVVGVGMPLIIKFSRAIPASYRDDVERRMTVTATPSQEGSWGWISPTEVHYRPKVFWKANSKVFTDVRLAGVPLGNGYYGKSDLTVDTKIGRSFVMTVSNKTKQMTVKQDGKVIKTIPVSLGKKSTPSSSGTMVVMEKARHTVFDTTDTDPVNGYKTPIDFAQRITWSGQFIHAAPWSEGKQGHVNVSHGCVNVSEAMGAWLFSRTMMGDPITVSGTEEKLKQGNGWTDFNVSYSAWKKLSYL